jgi:hypothetical protein
LVKLSQVEFLLLLFLLGVHGRLDCGGLGVRRTCGWRIVIIVFQFLLLLLLLVGRSSVGV